MGFEPQQPRSTLESANEFAECMALGIEEAKVALTKVKDEYSSHYFIFNFTLPLITSLSSHDLSIA
jgi:hypothetical protein